MSKSIIVSYYGNVYSSSLHANKLYLGYRWWVTANFIPRLLYRMKICVTDKKIYNINTVVITFVTTTIMLPY